MAMIHHPIVNYEFPCFGGKPGPILSDSILGGMMVLPASGLSTTTTTTTAAIADLSSLSCPYPTTDGIASSSLYLSPSAETNLLQSEFAVDNMDPSFQYAPAFAMEVWFTPLYSYSTIPTTTTTTINDDNATISTSSEPSTLLAGGQQQQQQQKDRHHDTILPIVTIGRPITTVVTSEAIGSLSSRNHNGSGGGAPDDYDWCEGLQLSVAQRGDVLEIRYKDYFNHYSNYYNDDDNTNIDFYQDDDDEDDEYDTVDNAYDDYNREMLNAEHDNEFSCRVLLLKDWKLVLQELHHVVLNWQLGGGFLEVYGNGILLVQIDLLGAGRVLDVNTPIPDLPFSLRSWDPNYRLQLFSNDLVAGHFPGMIHHVSIYNESLSKEAIQTIYEEGETRRAQGVMIDPDRPLYLVANPTDYDVLTVQGRPVTLTVGGNYNVSTPYWDILVEIIALPKYGDIRLDSLDGDLISAAAPGNRLPLDQAQPRTTITYQQRDENFYTIPTRSFYGDLLFPPDDSNNQTAATNATTQSSPSSQPAESFSYRLIAVDKIDPSRVLGWSDSIIQNVHIVHLNHPPSLTSPYEVTEPDQQPTDSSSSRPWAMLRNIVVNDTVDSNIDRVRVDVWALNGTLSIESDDIRQVADFDSCVNRPIVPSSSESSLQYSSHWYCFGDGSNDRNMTFLATPDNVSAILSNIRYDAFFWDQEDSITIRIFDGVGGPCLQDVEHIYGRYQFPAYHVDPTSRHYEYSTMRENCFMVVKDVRIPPLSRAYSLGDIGVRGFFKEIFDVKGFGLPDLIFWICIIFIIMACCCLGWTVQQICCCLKGAPIHVVNNPSSSIPQVFLASPPPDGHDVWATMDCYEGWSNEVDVEGEVPPSNAV